MKFPKIFGSKRPQNSQPDLDWRKQITRPASALVVGGFRPTEELTASCFGEVRVALEGEKWPEKSGVPLWPVCQLNLINAPFVPENLRDIAMLQIFVSEDWWSSDCTVVDSSDCSNSAFAIRVYHSLEGLEAVSVPDHGSRYLAFEARWRDEPLSDYPTHDTMPIDFDALGIGDYYDQDGIDGVHATKLGGWPSCIQSEPWWDYRQEGRDFEYVLQVDSEDKSKCWWGDGGAVYIARHKTKKTLWAVEGQCT